MTVPAVDIEDLSPHCAVAQRPEHRDMHGQCDRTEDIPLPGAIGVVLIHRCRCACHSLRPWRKL